MVFALLWTGCRTRQPDDGVRRYYFGVTTVTTPTVVQGKTNLFVSVVSNSGMMLGRDGLSLGFNRVREVSLPAANGLYLQVQNADQLEILKSFLKSYTNITLCVVESPSSKPASTSTGGR